MEIKSPSSLLCHFNICTQVISDASDDLRGGTRLEPREAIEASATKRAAVPTCQENKVNAPYTMASPNIYWYYLVSLIF